MYRIHVGRISEARKRNWYMKDDNPYAVTEGKLINEGSCTIDGIHACMKHLRDEVQIDWGSWAYKGNRQEIKALYRDLRWRCEVPDDIIPDEDYAFVFIES